jgi:PEP-CTERM motif
LLSIPSARLCGADRGNGRQSDPLPAIPVSAISGGIGDGFPDSDFYSFYWNGGAFAVSVGVPDASILTSPPSYLFELCNGTTCNDILQQTVADAGNDWASALSGELAAGYYTVGIIEQASAEDPSFVFRFETPLSQIANVPEPSTWALMLIGFAGLGYVGYRKATVPRAA